VDYGAVEFGMVKASELLAAWHPDVAVGDILTLGDVELVALPFSEATDWFDFRGAFGEDCILFIDPESVDTGTKTRIVRMGDPRPAENIRICVLPDATDLVINIGGDDSTIFLGRLADPFSGFLNAWQGSNIAIGDDATCNGARIICENSEVVIGADSMLSDELILQSTDQHDLLDLSTGTIIHQGRRSIRIGRHVWIGRRAMIMPDTTIGAGSIVGGGSIVKGLFEPCIACAGNPAKVVREQVTWLRERATVGPNEVAFLVDTMGSFEPEETDGQGG
jgi:acetyltransferase-like isoleucine patch superfamily enzyme